MSRRLYGSGQNAALRTLVCSSLLLLMACGQTAPTPQIVYVTPAPATATPEPTPSPTPTRAPTPTASPSAVTHRLVVRLTVTGDPDNTQPLGSTRCSGDSGYDDIKEGMQFEIRDGSEALMTFGSLTSSIYGPLLECHLSGTVTVPDMAVYIVDLGRRGTVNFRRDDLAANGWQAELSIGD